MCSSQKITFVHPGVQFLLIKCVPQLETFDYEPKKVPNEESNAIVWSQHFVSIGSTQRTWDRTKDQATQLATQLATADAQSSVPRHNPLFRGTIRPRIPGGLK